jgi:hypothetical protein
VITDTPIAAEGEGVPRWLLDPVLADAAARAGVDVSRVTVVSTELGTWPDRSLGCPQPGMAYVQALTEGYRIVLAAGGMILDYRMGTSGSFRLCRGGALHLPPGR